jgi:hypothetical protein
MTRHLFLDARVNSRDISSELLEDEEKTSNIIGISWIACEMAAGHVIPAADIPGSVPAAESRILQFMNQGIHE